ncbi:DUF6289 family protein [Catenulispora subtropica]|uniref:Peptidase inhibitor family I36 n=1 Tax=Catenulispora subtropica TaxID=450798 RepID=A0ABP5EF01_9ACTN
MKRHLASALAGLAVAGGLTLATTSSASAYPRCAAGYQCSWVYYTDAAHTTATGVRGFDCNGNLFSWGTTSAYVIYEQDTCGGGPVN